MKVGKEAFARAYAGYKTIPLFCIAENLNWAIPILTGLRRMKPFSLLVGLEVLEDCRKPGETGTYSLEYGWTLKVFFV